MVFDVVIVGGGPAGLSAALVLGRCRRRVLLCDAGHPRNASSRALHGYLTRDGIAPLALLRLGREELQPYDIKARSVTVTDVVSAPDGFDVTLENGERVQALTVLLATGVRDHVPDVPGMMDCYGTSVHHCPYCDGWEVRDKKIVVFGRGEAATGLALSLKTWSSNIAVCSHGARISRQYRQRLAAREIHVHDAAVAQVEHEDGHVRALALVTGEAISCDAVFFTTGQSQQCDLPSRLGCEITSKGVVKTDHLGKTCVPGLFVVGDASRDVQFVVVAAAEGAKAAVAINKVLQTRAGLAVTPELAVSQP